MSRDDCDHAWFALTGKPYTRCANCGRLEHLETLDVRPD